MACLVCRATDIARRTARGAIAWAVREGAIAPWLIIVAAFIAYASHALETGLAHGLTGTLARIAVVGAWLFAAGYLLGPEGISARGLACGAAGGALPALLGVSGIPGVLASLAQAPIGAQAAPMFAAYALVSALFSVPAPTLARATLVGLHIFLVQLAVDVVLAFFGLYGPWNMA